jgi:hypothetical protein
VAKPRFELRDSNADPGMARLVTGNGQKRIGITPADWNRDRNHFNDLTFRSKRLKLSM